MNNDLFITNWVLKTVKEEYADDIALVISHSTLSLDPNTAAISYFVPITQRGRQFAQTFIYEGCGYDIWGIEWERLERFAALEEYNLTVLADSQILYARSPEDAARFEALRQRQRENLASGKTARKYALIAYSTAQELYTRLLFAEKHEIRVFAGYILDYLARAVAFHNHSYFRHSQTRQLEELAHMEQVPAGFAECYLEIIRTNDDDQRRKLCYEAIRLVRDFLAVDSKIHQEHNFQDLADWYAELSYTWLRIRRYAAENDPIRVHMWGILLQKELNDVCDDFGLEKMALMDAYDYQDLSPFVERADRLEQRMRYLITSNGGHIREYHSSEEFLNEV